MRRGKVVVALLLLIGFRLGAALPSTIVWEVRPGVGSNSNGGGFDSAETGVGTDYSQQNSAQYNFTDLATASTTTVTSASHSFVTADVGNIIHISAGTGYTTGWYEITSVSGGAATLDRSPGAMGLSGGTWFEGGALLTLQQMNTNAVAGNSAWVKATATISQSATESINFTSPSANEYTQVAGYTSTRGDGGQVTVTAASGVNGPVIAWAVTGMFANFIINCNAQTNAKGFDLTAVGAMGMNILSENCSSSYGLQFGADGEKCIRCTVTGTATGLEGSFFISSTGTNALCVQCVAYANAVPGFVQTESNFTCLQCISANNTGATTDGFQLIVTTGSFVLLDSVAYGNGRDGLRFTGTGAGTATVTNTVFYGNTGYGVNYSTTGLNAAGSAGINYNAYGGNTSGARNGGVLAGGNDVTLSSDPFVAGASENFALSAGGILAIGTAGYPGALAVGGTGFQPIGALVPQNATSICLGRVISSLCTPAP